MLIKDERRGSIIIQVTIVMGICIMLTGVIALITQTLYSEKMVNEEAFGRSFQTARETEEAIKEYKCYKWLMMYWYEHADEMDIEYDVNYYSGKKTRQKLRLLNEHEPDLDIQYADRRTIEGLSPEDQKLYAEICYSWILTHVNSIYRFSDASFVFLVLSDKPYDQQFFLLSASDGKAKRGTTYEDAYILGVTVDISESQRQSMVNSMDHEYQRADAGEYLDYYMLFDEIDGHKVFIGVTINKADVRTTQMAHTERGSVYAMGYVLFLSLIIMLSIWMLVLRPLKTIQENIRLYRDDKDSAEVDANLLLIRANSNNEIGELASDVTDLAKEIDEHVERISRITAERERIGTELSLASEIQNSILPHDFPAFPEREEFEIYASMEPAREVGGDFYDFYMIDDDHLGMIIADVSGKGIPAALFMMVSKSILKSYAMSGLSAAEILRVTNESICSNNLVDMFVTVWIGILELSTGRMTAANAGHDYPAIRNANGKFRLFRDEHGFVLGGMPGLIYKEYELYLSPGSKIFVYTDGIPEATNADGNMFGTNRMIDALNIDPGAEPDAILRTVRESVEAFVEDAEQFDDMTMMCIEYNGRGDKQA